MRNLKFLFIFVFILIGSALFAQQVSPEMKAANQLLQDKKYPEAVKAYEQILQKEPENGLAYYYIGMSEYYIKDYKASINAYEEAAKILTGPNVCYNLAGVYSLSGSRDKAIEWLEKAVKNGFAQYNLISSDNDFDNIKNDPKFKEIVESIKIKSNPCLSRPEYSQLNFWLGDWDVANKQGVPMGQSKEELIGDGCVLVENWYGKGGGAGKSFNYFDAKDNKWHQFWIAKTAIKTTYEGKLEGKDMVYYSYDHANEGAKSYLQRLTFFNLGPDKVRQFSEISTDNGKSWTVGYDFYYTRKTNSN